LRFRPYLAVVGCAAAVVLATAVPAVAASAPPTTTAPVAAPTRDSQPLPVKCPADAASAARVKVAIAKAAKDGKRVDIVEACQLLEKRGAIPKGAPETGGGGMAAEVGSWG
jgi:hypothetical protein